MYMYLYINNQYKVCIPLKSEGYVHLRSPICVCVYMCTPPPPSVFAPLPVRMLPYLPHADLCWSLLICVGLF